MMNEQDYDLYTIFQDLRSDVDQLDVSSVTLSSSLDLAFDEVFPFQQDIGQIDFQQADQVNVKRHFSENLFPELQDNPMVRICRARDDDNQGIEPSIITSKPKLEHQEEEEDLSYEFIDRRFISEPSKEQMSLVNPSSLFLRWLNIPPERVHATSPSKLVESPRYGTPFNFAVQLVSRCTDGTFVPFKAVADIPIIANIYGKRKPKTGASKVSQDKTTTDFVKLELNPVGKPLMVYESSLTIPGVRAVIKEGESIASFEGASLTCGSNAARSQNAPAAARVWDWDYHIKVESINEDFKIKPVISKHITTDSNRSQTREKRKRETTISSPIPPAKRRLYHSLPSDNFQQVKPKVFSAFKSDMYDFSATFNN